MSLFNIIKTLVNVLSFRNWIYENNSLDISKIFIQNTPSFKQPHSHNIACTPHESNLWFEKVSCFPLSELYLQTGLLWEQVGASANSAYFYRRHRAADVQVFVGGTSSLHQSDAVGAAHILRSILQIKEEKQQSRHLNQCLIKNYWIK